MSIPIMKDFLLQLSFITILVFSFQIFFAERSGRDRRVKVILSLLFGVSILICMSFPAYADAHFRLDIRIIPLLLGTLYGGWGTGIVLSALIVLYRSCFGIDLGFLSTVLTLAFSMPVILIFRKPFMKAERTKKLRIALLLSAYYSLVGLAVITIIRGFSTQVFQVQLIHMIITLTVLLLFISLNETIRDMIRKNRQLQSDAKAAEIAFLRSQIKPHFLYNALNSIAALCADEPLKAEELTLDLSQFLRGSFNFKTLDFLTTLQNELELINAYVNIEKARFGDRLRVEFDVDAAPHLLIPPLILQPLVENAIRHGLMSNFRGGTVKISIKQEADAEVSFTVEDDGRGMTEHQRGEILKPNAEKKGIGLWNISQRLKLLYGKAIRIDSTEGMGTKVSFGIPGHPVKQMGG